MYKCILETDNYIIALTWWGQSLSMFACLFVKHDVFYISWLPERKENQTNSNLEVEIFFQPTEFLEL